MVFLLELHHSFVVQANFMVLNFIMHKVCEAVKQFLLSSINIFIQNFYFRDIWQETFSRLIPVLPSGSLGPEFILQSKVA